MIPSIGQLTSGLSFAFSLLRGRPFDLIKSQVNIGPLGLWHVPVSYTHLTLPTKA